MDQSTNRFGFSSVPKVSKLPVSRGSESVRNGQAPYTLKSRAIPGLSLRNGRGAISPDATPARDSQSIRPSDDKCKDVDAGLKTEKLRQDRVDYSTRARTLPRRPRPSLSDRTMETLSQIPPSPSPRRRQSGFFSSESPAPSSRPVSSLSRSRPGTSHSQHPPLPSGFPTPRPQSPIKRPLIPGSGNQVPITSPSKRAVSSNAAGGLPLPGRKPYDDRDSTPSKPRPTASGNDSLSHKLANTVIGKPSISQIRGSKTLAARPSKPRPSVQDVFAKPPARTNVPARPRAAAPASSIDKSSTPSKTATKAAADSPGSPSIPASSTALRETIARAKAARRDINKLQSKGLARPVPKVNGFPDLEVGEVDEDLLRSRVAKARIDGRLNIAALGLTEMPLEVTNMYSSNVGTGAWYESVDLVRLIAADNDFEQFDPNVFPDSVPEAPNKDDDYQGNMFGGLETLDLHNNCLKELPLGLRRLERLTTLNLSKNSLGMEGLRIVSQILPLRELRLGGNALNGTLSTEICNLSNLEVLDLHDNALSALSSDLQRLTNLRVLDVAGNRLASLPFNCLASLPLVELNVARNRLSGSLFPSSIDGLPHLKSLDVANNALTSLTNDRLIHLPSLQDLGITENRLKSLPDVSGWMELITLTAGGNKLSTLPEGFTSLQKIKTVDFSRNDLKNVDERVGLMGNLIVLRVANNPLRERKFLTMDTGEMKRELQSRIQPTDSPHIPGHGLFSYDGSDPANTPSTSDRWPVKAGVLDRSSTKLETIEPSEFKSLTEGNDIKTMVLHHNLLPHIPPAIVFASHTLAYLDISNNKLISAKYLFTELSLPNLKSLDTSSNGIASLGPLIEYLEAPRLAEMNVGRNCLTSLPPLRSTFPSLTTVYASDNKISKLPVESVKGLQVLDVCGNDINHLEPKLGLLEEHGLRTLAIGANTFRVPRRDVIDKGTAAVLAWLKSRIPEEELLGLG